LTECANARARRMVDADAREGANGTVGTKRAAFAKWVPRADARGVDVVASPRGADGCPYELVEGSVSAGVSAGAGAGAGAGGMDVNA